MYAIVGLGATGLSCARFLTLQALPFIVLDTRETPPNSEAFKIEFPSVPMYTGIWPANIFNNVKTCLVSPGISVQHPALVAAQQAGVEMIGDVELFVRFNKKPIIAITGANGKSTVTTLVGEMVKAAHKKVAVVGNIGTPVLDLITQTNESPDIIVMELSSFQLETTSSLAPLAATVLNITPDHLDRYTSFEDYVKAKHRIFNQAHHVVINKQDPLSFSSSIDPAAKQWFFTLEKPVSDEFGLHFYEGEYWLAKGDERLLPASAMKIQGQHNLGNALSALALGQAAGLPMAAMLEAIQTYTGLPHRCQWVACENNIQWINDSKGTNTGACEAALQGLGNGHPGKIVLLLGGDGKGADFSTLIPYITKYCRAIIVMGKDTQVILQTLSNIVPAFIAEDMHAAVKVAQAQAQSGDIVLLSPACASTDQYRDYNHRGEIFMDEVKKLGCYER